MCALAPVPRICGREAEIQALGEALDRVAAGGPAIVLVEARPGSARPACSGLRPSPRSAEMDRLAAALDAAGAQLWSFTA